MGIKIKLVWSGEATRAAILPHEGPRCGSQGQRQQSLRGLSALREEDRVLHIRLLTFGACSRALVDTAGELTRWRTFLRT